MGEKSIDQLFDSAVKKCQKFTANPLKECKKNVLSEFTVEAKNYLDKWVVEIEESSDYSIMNHLGLIDDTYFYREHPVLGVLGLGDFYKRIEVKDDTVVHVKKIKDFKDEEIERILEALEEEISRKGVRELVAPSGFFVFQFQALYSNEEPSKERKGKIENLIFKADIPDQAINQLKEILRGMKENYFRNFMVFYNNRWRILKTKLNGGWLPKGYIFTANLKLIS